MEHDSAIRIVSIATVALTEAVTITGRAIVKARTVLLEHAVVVVVLARTGGHRLAKVLVVGAWASCWYSWSITIIRVVAVLGDQGASALPGEQGRGLRAC